MATHDERYEALRKKGMTKEKAATTPETLEGTKAKHGAERQPLEDRSKEQLEDKARHHGIPNRGDMKKHDLLSKIRRHS